MKIFRCTFAILLLAAATHAAAQAYKCLDQYGKIEYRGSPCAASQTVEKTFTQSVAPNDAERVGRPIKASPPANNEREHTPAATVTHRDNGEKPTENRSAPPTTPVLTTVTDGVCTGPFTWDACRKLGVDSVVDCKRMDEDVVFRTSVLQSKGIQCRYSDAGTRRHR